MSENKPRPVRFAIVGSNFITEKFLAAAPQSPGFVLDTFYSRSPDRAREFAARFGAPHAESDWQRLLASDTVDAVYLATPNACHAQQACALLAAGKHVLCEKPAARSAALDPKHRAKAGLAQAKHDTPAQAMQRIGKAHTGGRFALPRRGGADGGDENHLAVRLLFQPGNQPVVKLCLITAIGADTLRVKAQPLCNLFNGQHLCLLCNFNIGFHVCLLLRLYNKTRRASLQPRPNFTLLFYRFFRFANIDPAAAGIFFKLCHFYPYGTVRGTGRRVNDIILFQ